jgi:(p)ppGpp synthase/HD superfamily hydrolase
MRTRTVGQVTEADLPTFPEHLLVARNAITFARDLHRHQSRASDGAPFIVHPLEVAEALYNVSCSDRVVAAGVLHDVIEDTSTVIEEIRRRFGVQVAELVAALTENPDIADPRERKAALRAQVQDAGPDAATIFAADKVTKVRELRTLMAQPARASAAELEYKREHYIASLEMLERVIPDQPLTRQLRFELEALQTLPPSLGDQGSGRGRRQGRPYARALAGSGGRAPRGEPG